MAALKFLFYMPQAEVNCMTRYMRQTSKWSRSTSYICGKQTSIGVLHAWTEVDWRVTSGKQRSINRAVTCRNHAEAITKNLRLTFFRWMNNKPSFVIYFAFLCFSKLLMIWSSMCKATLWMKLVYEKRFIAYFLSVQVCYGNTYLGLSIWS